MKLLLLIDCEFSVRACVESCNDDELYRSLFMHILDEFTSIDRSTVEAAILSALEGDYKHGLIILCRDIDCCIRVVDSGDMVPVVGFEEATRRLQRW